MKRVTFILIIASLFFSCKKSLIEPGLSPDMAAMQAKEKNKDKKKRIGDVFAGGFVFYIDATSMHGLVCATEDAGTGSPWDLTIFDVNNWQLYNPPLVGGTGTALGTGSANTTAIINSIGADSYAAKVCRNYNGGGYTDWFLPSKDELGLMTQNLKITGIASFPGSFYWSSSEIDYRAVWSMRSSDNTLFEGAWKNNLMSVRPVRAF